MDGAKSAPETAATRLADQVRRLEATSSPSALYKIAVNGDDYRHAMIHAGWVIPKDAPAFLACPECAAALHAATKGEERDG